MLNIIFENICIFESKIQQSRLKSNIPNTRVFRKLTHPQRCLYITLYKIQLVTIFRMVDFQNQLFDTIQTVSMFDRTMAEN